MRWSSTGSVPYSRDPMSDSPESFRRIRLKAGSAPMAGKSLFVFANGEACEACDLDVLAGLRSELGAELLDRLARVAVGVDVRLLEQSDLLRPLRKLAVDDPPDHFVGLALLAGLRLVDGAFSLAGLLGDLLRRDELRQRWRAGDVEGHLAGEILEVLATSDEVRLAAHLDEHPDASARVDVGRDRALARRPAAALGS